MRAASAQSAAVAAAMACSTSWRLRRVWLMALFGCGIRLRGRSREETSFRKG